MTLSVAMLPIAGGAAMSMMPADMSASMSAGEPMDCCPGHAKHDEKSIDDCCAMAICALKCFGYSGTISSLAPLLMLGDLMLPFESDQFRSQAVHPPFRPPRV